MIVRAEGQHGLFIADLIVRKKVLDFEVNSEVVRAFFCCFGSRRLTWGVIKSAAIVDSDQHRQVKVAAEIDSLSSEWKMRQWKK